MLFVLSESQEELGRCQKENDRLAVELEQAAMVAQVKVEVAIFFNFCIFYHSHVGSTFLTSRIREVRSYAPLPDNLSSRA